MFIIRFSFFFSSFTNNYQFFEISSSQLPFFLSSQSEEKNARRLLPKISRRPSCGANQCPKTARADRLGKFINKLGIFVPDKKLQEEDMLEKLELLFEKEWQMYSYKVYEGVSYTAKGSELVRLFKLR